MKKLNIPEYYPRYYTATDHPEIIDVENANFISILAKGSFTEEIFYQRIALLKQAAQVVIDLFQDSGKSFALGCAAQKRRRQSAESANSRHDRESRKLNNVRMPR